MINTSFTQDHSSSSVSDGQQANGMNHLVEQFSVLEVSTSTSAQTPTPINQKMIDATAVFGKMPHTTFQLSTEGLYVIECSLLWGYLWYLYDAEGNKAKEGWYADKLPNDPQAKLEGACGDLMSKGAFYNTFGLPKDCVNPEQINEGFRLNASHYQQTTTNSLIAFCERDESVEYACIQRDGTVTVLETLEDTGLFGPKMDAVEFYGRYGNPNTLSPGLIHA